MSVGEEKNALRRKMRLVLQKLTLEERVARSEKICAAVVDSDCWRTAASVLLFSPLQTEPQIAPLQTAAVAGGKQTGIIPQTLRQESDLELLFAPDLILVPGLAFSRRGHRLGRGGGFYDRLLAGRGAGAKKLGLCFTLQLHDVIPAEPYDAVMDAVIAG